MIYLLKHLGYAFISTIGFAFIFNTPKAALLRSGLAGAFGWAVYIVVNQVSGSVVLSTFMGSLCIGLVGEVFAILNKNPITVYIIPGIVPLVPGFGLYNTMLSLLENDYDGALLHGSQSVMIAIAIAGALTIALSVNSYRKRVFRRRSRLKI
ncbi:threonine/serine exporter family protein [Alkaliphilus hydrothermalis]|uniref:Uncharacterized membrane protein YjjB (DUF3815 family) n=1 Tax=Alkaliphilus hydrothermalis TaxID=1482730 RepID=A0ABS2NLT3_9FIRM|nr:threonine/serine exporter family protein [Alkaliphilus hydrothermalis]MBM7613905.1 uncharacterized membrane protein YjjB (DUF3815 family) [Alkaliphilus hydrothermalis]